MTFALGKFYYSLQLHIFSYHLYGIVPFDLKQTFFLSQQRNQREKEKNMAFLNKLTMLKTLTSQASEQCDIINDYSIDNRTFALFFVLLLGNKSRFASKVNSHW